MRMELKLGIGLALSGLALALPAHALEFDQNVTNNVIMGSGVGNGGWTVDRNASIGQELGLRAKVRYSIPGDAPQDVFNSNGAGTYNHATGSPAAPPAATNRARWNFEWSVNSNYNGAGQNLDALTYKLGIDSDPSNATSFFVFDLFNHPNHFDHSLGNNATAQSAGAEFGPLAAMQAQLGNFNLAQNSWNMEFFDSGSGDISFDPTIDATYSFFLAAYRADSEIGRTSITVIVGAGGQDVPEPMTGLLLGGALFGLAAAKRRKAG